MGEENSGLGESLGSRHEADLETARLLALNSKFLADLESVREDFYIPLHLESGSDVFAGHFFDNDGLGKIFTKTAYMNFLIEENQQRLSKRILDIVKKWKLGLNFVQWIQWFILYREPAVLDSSNLLLEISASSIGGYELLRVPRNTQEKKYIMALQREALGIPARGRVAEKYLKHFAGLKKYLNRHKPLTRKSRINGDETLRFLKVLGTTETVIDPVTQKARNYKVKYNTIISKTGDDFSDIIEDKKKAQSMRKQKQRMLKRSKNIEN